MAGKTQTKKSTKTAKKVTVEEEVVVDNTIQEEKVIEEIQSLPEVEGKAEVVEETPIVEEKKEETVEVKVVEPKPTKKKNSVVDPFGEEETPVHETTATVNKKVKAPRPITIQFDTWNGQYIM